MGNHLHIIMYHYVRELPLTRYPRIKGLLISQFEEQIKYLIENGYTFVSAQTVTEAALVGAKLPDKSVFLTFDDGYIDHYTNVFPLLNRLGIPAFFSMPGKILTEHRLLDVNRIHFVLASKPIEALLPLLYKLLDAHRGAEFDIPTNAALYEKLAVPGRFDDKDTIFVKRLLQVDLPERLRGILAEELFRLCVADNEESFVKELYMDAEQVRFMARSGMSWGIHGYDHYWMNRLTPEALERDITKALDVFSGIVDPKSWICCYPYGSVDGNVVDCVSKHGCALGLTTVVGQADLEKDDRYQLPRFDTNDFPPKSNTFEQYT